MRQTRSPFRISVWKLDAAGALCWISQLEAIMLLKPYVLRMRYPYRVEDSLMVGFCSVEFLKTKRLGDSQTLHTIKLVSDLHCEKL